MAPIGQFIAKKCKSDNIPNFVSFAKRNLSIYGVTDKIKAPEGQIGDHRKLKEFHYQNGEANSLDRLGLR